MPKKSPLPKKETIKEVLEASGGFITIASRKLNCHYSTLYRYLQRNVSVRSYLRQIRESYLDLAEAELIKLVKAGNLGAICFYLKCQGKERGWYERQEITGKDGERVLGIVILPMIKEIDANQKQ